MAVGIHGRLCRMVWEVPEVIIIAPAIHGQLLQMGWVGLEPMNMAREKVQQLRPTVWVDIEYMTDFLMQTSETRVIIVLSNPLADCRPKFD